MCSSDLLMKEKKEGEIIRLDLENTRVEIEEQKKEWGDKLRSLKLSEQEIVQEARDKVVLASAELEKEIRQSASALRKERSMQGIQNARKTIRVVAEKLNEAAWQMPKIDATEEGQGYINSVAEGDMVQIRGINAEAKVISISDRSNQLQIQIGQTRLWMSRDSLEKVMPQQDDKSNKSGIPVRKEFINRSVPLELNLRGKRAEEVEWILEGYLSDASMSTLKHVRIIHGHGTGTVRSITRDFLSSSPLVKSFRPGEQSEGGDGVTVVSL